MSVPKNVKRSIGRLDTPFLVRKFATRLATHVLRGEISPQQSSSINGLLMTALKTMEMADFVEKLEELERSIKKMKRK